VSEVVNLRLDRVEETLRAMSDAVTRLVRVEERHVETREALERAFKEIAVRDDRAKGVEADHEERIRKIEAEMGTVKLARNWVIGAVLAAWMAIAGVFLKWPSPQIPPSIPAH
jgi:hypothetical protein